MVTFYHLHSSKPLVRENGSESAESGLTEAAL